MHGLDLQITDPDENAFTTYRSVIFGDKWEYLSQFGGYPVWIQGDETPCCPLCGERAEFVAAIGSGDASLSTGPASGW